MDNNINSTKNINLKPVTPEGSKKKICMREIFYLFLFAFGVIALVFVGIQMCSKGLFCKNNQDIEKIAVESLKAKKGFPDDLKVTAISDLDSVFVNRYCPEHETIELSQKYLEYTMTMMGNGFDLDDQHSMMSLKRYSEASDALTLFNEMLQKPQGEHIGWRMRLRCTYLDENKTQNESEVWMIFDKGKKYIFNTFEFPII